MVKSLGKYAVDLLPEEVKNYLAQFEHCFNPSIVLNELNCYMSIRVVGHNSGEIFSILITWDVEGNWNHLNLSINFLEQLGLEKVADPKLFKLGAEVYCTFNTGFQSKTNNKIFLGKIDDFDSIHFKECILEKRQRVEKNWAFFEKDDQLHALYSIQPLVVLTVAQIEEDKIHFEPLLQKESDLPKYSIGTPLAKLGDFKYLFISHKKLFIKGKRSYFGVPMIFDAEKMELTRATSKYLIHSLTSMLGNKKKWNPNLISCTYFSGIVVDNEYILLSYGINDLNMRIIKMPKKMII